MKYKKYGYCLLILFATHYLHYLYYKFTEVKYPFYNTVFSVKDLPMQFYKINVGDNRLYVENLIGKPLDSHYGYFDYSLPGDEFFGSNFSVSFQIKYENDIVVEKRVIQDD